MMVWNRTGVVGLEGHVSFRRVVLHRHAWREDHRLFPKAPHLEHVDLRDLEHELSALLQGRPVVGDDLREIGGGAVKVVALAAAGIVGADELRAGIDRQAESLLGRLACRSGLAVRPAPAEGLSGPGCPRASTTVRAPAAEDGLDRRAAETAVASGRGRLPSTPRIRELSGRDASSDYSLVNLRGRSGNSCAGRGVLCNAGRRLAGSEAG